MKESNTLKLNKTVLFIIVLLSYTPYFAFRNPSQIYVLYSALFFCTVFAYCNIIITKHLLIRQWVDKGLITAYYEPKGKSQIIAIIIYMFINSAVIVCFYLYIPIVFCIINIAFIGAIFNSGFYGNQNVLIIVQKLYPIDNIHEIRFKKNTSSLIRVTLYKKKYFFRPPSTLITKESAPLIISYIKRLKTISCLSRDL